LVDSNIIQQMANIVPMMCITCLPEHTKLPALLPLN